MKRALLALGGVTALAIATAWSGAAWAQAAPETPPPTVGVLAQPCGAVEPIPAEVVAFVIATMKAKAVGQPPPAASPEGLARYEAWTARQLQQDFAQHCKYQAANASLPPAGDHRVVMFGDSITELWGTQDPSFFQNDVINRGISGQTTAQMVVRFRNDVVNLHPRVVHILAGANDVAGNTGVTSLDWIEANIRSMVDLAKVNGIRVVLGSELPTAKYGWRPAIEPVESLLELNRRLSRLAAEEGIEFVDYYAALDDGRHGLPAKLSDDGVHPNASGYAVMRPLTQAALARALKVKRPTRVPVK